VAQVKFSDRGEALQKALSYMEVALELLDGAEAPAEIGAHLDLALCRLREVVGDAEGQISGASADPAATDE
jgi:hypothetical protein